MCCLGKERQGMQVMLASFKAPYFPWEMDNKSSELSASFWPLCSLVWSQTYGDWLQATSFKLAGQECWLSAHLPLSFCHFQGASMILLSCWYLSGPRLFFIAPTRKAIGHSKKLWTRAKCRQIKEWEQKSYICRVKLCANGFGAAEMEEEFHHVELLMRKQPALPCPPPRACVSQLKWYAVYCTALEEKK